MKFTALLSVVLCFAYPLLGNVNERHFQKVVLDDTCKEPMELAVAGDGKVYFIERTGAIKVWDPDSKKTSTLAKLNVFFRYVGDKSGGGWEDGLIGLTLDPGFEKNHWLYVYYSPTDVSENRLARFLVEQNKVNLNSEKIILRVPTDRTACCHSSGSLAFNEQGHLFISTGDNTDPFESDGYAPIDFRPDRQIFDASRTSGNKMDLRGKILKIKPTEDGTYVIPDGNLFNPDGLKGKAEIFVMGCRNPFRISVDSKMGTLFWGDVGPDAREKRADRGPAGFDEINRTDKAGNFGWPFFMADNKPYRAYDFQEKTSGDIFDPNAPLNKSPNNPASPTLPPAQPAWIYYSYSPSIRFSELGSGGRAAAAGPVYHYNADLKSDRKLPVEFDNNLFIYDWERGWIKRVELNADKQKIRSFANHLSFKRPIDMELGPDGALYLIEWGTGWGVNNDSKIVRVEYRP